MKDYLNNIEEKESIVICTAKNLTEHFANGKLLTKGELADMRRGTSFMMKTVESLLKRLDQKYVDKFLRLAKSSKTIVISETELNVIKKRKDAELNAAFEDSKEYFDLVEITMDLNCRNCTKCFKDCDLYRHFDEQQITPFDEYTEVGHCKFAYRKEV